MAYIGQEQKKEIAAEIKKALKGVPLKWTLAVHRHTKLVINIRGGAVDFIGNYNKTAAKNKNFDVGDGYLQVNEYYLAIGSGSDERSLSVGLVNMKARQWRV